MNGTNEHGHDFILKYSLFSQFVVVCFKNLLPALHSGSMRQTDTGCRVCYGLLSAGCLELAQREMLKSNASSGGILNRLGKIIEKVPHLEPAGSVELTRCLVCAFVDDSGIFHTFGCHLPHGVQHERLAQTPTAVVWVNAGLCSSRIWTPEFLEVLLDWTKKIFWLFSTSITGLGVEAKAPTRGQYHALFFG